MRVIGIDRSAALLEQGRERTDADVIVADLLEWQAQQKAAAVLCRRRCRNRT